MQVARLPAEAHYLRRLGKRGLRDWWWVDQGLELTPTMIKSHPPRRDIKQIFPTEQNPNIRDQWLTRKTNLCGRVSVGGNWIHPESSGRSLFSFGWRTLRGPRFGNSGGPRDPSQPPNCPQWHC